jgi:hypothetical protein
MGSGRRRESIPAPFFVMENRAMPRKGDRMPVEIANIWEKWLGRSHLPQARLDFDFGRRLDCSP